MLLWIFATTAGSNAAESSLTKQLGFFPNFIIVSCVLYDVQFSCIRMIYPSIIIIQYRYDGTVMCIVVFIMQARLSPTTQKSKL